MPNDALAPTDWTVATERQPSAGLLIVLTKVLSKRDHAAPTRAFDGPSAALVAAARRFAPSINALVADI
jgi:hypothetical protein